MSEKSLDQRIRDEVALLREYQGSEQMLQLRGLLVLIEDAYKEQLADVAAGDLLKVQGALKQTRALRESIFGSGAWSPLL